MDKRPPKIPKMPMLKGRVVAKEPPPAPPAPPEPTQEYDQATQPEEPDVSDTEAESQMNIVEEEATQPMEQTLPPTAALKKSKKRKTLTSPSRQSVNLVNRVPQPELARLGATVDALTKFQQEQNSSADQQIAHLARLVSNLPVEQQQLSIATQPVPPATQPVPPATQPIPPATQPTQPTQPVPPATQPTQSIAPAAQPTQPVPSISAASPTPPASLPKKLPKKLPKERKASSSSLSPSSTFCAQVDYVYATYTRHLAPSSSSSSSSPSSSGSVAPPLPSPFSCFKCGTHEAPLLIMLCECHFLCGGCFEKEVAVAVSLSLDVVVDKKVNELGIPPAAPQIFLSYQWTQNLNPKFSALCCDRAPSSPIYLKRLIQKNSAKLQLDKFYYGTQATAGFEKLMNRITAFCKSGSRNSQFCICKHCEQTFWMDKGILEKSVVVEGSTSCRVLCEKDSQVAHNCLSFACNLCKKPAEGKGKEEAKEEKEEERVPTDLSAHIAKHRIWSSVDVILEICSKWTGGDLASCAEMVKQRALAIMQRGT